MIGLLGGTFDPIHSGHLRIALDVVHAISLTEVRFIPCKQPVHRDQPILDPEQRLSLLKLAVQDQQKFVVDDRELHREGPSYMVDTLESIKREFPDESFALLVGSDAFASFDQWHRWQEIFELAHVVIMQRPGKNSCFSSELSTEYDKRVVKNTEMLAKKSAGSIICVPVIQLDISASDIRQKIVNKQDIHYLVPEAVRASILEEKFYR